jgi:hypothetical protein
VGSRTGELYPKVVEFGRKAKMPPYTELIEWVKDKLGAGVNAARIAWRVAAKLGAKKMKGKFYLWGAWKDSRAQVNEIFRKVPEQVAQDLAVKGSGKSEEV